MDNNAEKTRWARSIRRMLLDKISTSLALGLVTLTASYQQAFAAPVTLICTWSGSYAASSSEIILDDAARSITIYYPPIHNPGGIPNPIPGSLMGTFTAKFSPNEISFVDQEGNPRKLNRLSGSIEWYGTNRHPIGSTETCAVGKAKF